MYCDIGIFIPIGLSINQNRVDRLVKPFNHEWQNILFMDSVEVSRF